MRKKANICQTCSNNAKASLIINSFFINQLPHEKHSNYSKNKYNGWHAYEASRSGI